MEGTILIVDDTPTNLGVLFDGLREAGFRVLVATSGQAALDAVKLTLPDIILLDVRMPEMDGFETCSHLKADEATREIPIVFITALTDPVDEVRGLQLGAVDYITKPIKVQSVLARISTHLTVRRLQKDLELQNAELAAYDHTVAHGLKNPLAVIVAYSELLLQKDASVAEEDRRSYLARVVQEGRKMNDIVDEVLLLASVRELGDVSLVPLDMAVVVEAAKRRLANEIEERGAEVDAPLTWPVAVGYAPWVEEVWVNYVSNALKYGGDPPHVELGASVERMPGPGNGEVVRFWVRDNGAGLSPEEQGRLFAPFTRLEQARAAGHGLGLSIVRRIVERLGGQVSVESTVGEGSVFGFTLTRDRPLG